MIRTTRLTLYRALRAVALFQSRDETRRHLQGVRFEHDRDRLELIATDGHTMGRATLVAVGSLESFTLPTGAVESLLGALKCRPRDDHEIELYHPAPGVVKVTASHGPICEHIISLDKFPPWRQVTPERSHADDTAAALHGLNPMYFARAGKAAEYFAGGKGTFSYRGFAISTGDALDPVRFDYSHPDTGDLCVVLMPMRV